MRRVSQLAAVEGLAEGPLPAACGRDDIAGQEARLHKLHPKPAPGACPICERPTVAWVLDHDHAARAFRGLLSCRQYTRRSFLDRRRVTTKMKRFVPKRAKSVAIKT